MKGQLHRPPADGPAIVVTDDRNDGKGARRIEEYWVEGQLHRPHQDGPAMFYTHYKKFDLSGEEYFENGKWHRPSELGPAVTHWDRNGEPVMVIYYENGEHHRDPKEGPAWWHIHDCTNGPDRRAALHRNPVLRAGRRFTATREDGPALIKRDNETGVLTTEEYWRDGYFYREDGPAIIHRSPEGAVFYEAYWRGKHYRDASEGPGTIVYDEQGHVQAQEWFGEDGRHRDAAKGPGRISYLSGGRVQEDFYVDGEYRPAALGPASVTRDREGNIVREEFWDGKRMHPHPPARQRRRPALMARRAPTHSVNQAEVEGAIAGYFGVPATTPGIGDLVRVVFPGVQEASRGNPAAWRSVVLGVLANHIGMARSLGLQGSELQRQLQIMRASNRTSADFVNALRAVQMLVAGMGGWSRVARAVDGGERTTNSNTYAALEAAMRPTACRWRCAGMWIAMVRTMWRRWATT